MDIKLKTDFPTSDSIVNVSPAARYAVICVMLYVKAHGSKGCTKSKPGEIARAYNLGVGDVEEALRADLFVLDGNEIRVVNWPQYQIDSTKAERQARYRAKKRARDGSDGERRQERQATDAARIKREGIKKGAIKPGEQGGEATREDLAAGPEMAGPAGLEDPTEVGPLCSPITTEAANDATALPPGKLIDADDPLWGSPAVPGPSEDSEYDYYEETGDEDDGIF